MRDPRDPAEWAVAKMTPERLRRAAERGNRLAQKILARMAREGQRRRKH